MCKIHLKHRTKSIKIEKNPSLHKNKKQKTKKNKKNIDMEWTFELRKGTQ